MFKHEFLPRTEITNEDLPTGRVYSTPDGQFDSVTTIIGRASNNDWLEEWRNRIGKAEAEGITTQAGIRGTAVHLLAERYVMNDPKWKRGAMPNNVASFLGIKHILDKRVDVIYGVEYPLWSTTLRTAGRSDLPCRFDGINTIGDFKTSRGMKAREDIDGYFIQSTAYAIMMEERTGVRFPQVAIMIAQDKDHPVVYLEKAKDWYSRVIEVFIDRKWATT